MELNADNVYRSTRFQTGEDLDRALAAALEASNTDTTLSVEGKAADAKATGEALEEKLGLKGGTLTGPLYYKSTSNQFLRTDNISAFNLCRAQKKSYVGTGAYGIGNKKSLSFAFKPKVVIIKRQRKELPTNDDGTEKVTGVNDVMMIAFYGEIFAASSWLSGETSYLYHTHLSWSGNTMYWWGISDTQHLNRPGKTYHVLAIG